MKRRQVSLRYCSACKATTRHTEAENTTTCTRCGTVKLVARVIRQVPPEKREDLMCG